MTSSVVEPELPSDEVQPVTRRPRRRPVHPLVRAVWRRTDVALPIVIIVLFTVWFVVLRRYWWYADDFLYLVQSKNATLDIPFLRVSNYGHFAPVTRTAYWISSNWFGADHNVSALLSVIPAAVSTFLASLIVKELAPSRPSLRWLVLIPSFTVFMYRVLPWWGASIHVLVGLMWSHLVIYCFVKHLRTGRWAWLVGSQVALVCGLLTQERPMIAVGTCFLLRFVARPGEGRWPAWKPEWRNDLIRFVPFGVIVLVAMWNQFTNYPNGVASPTVGQFVSYLRIAFTDYFLPGIFGERGGEIGAFALLVRWGAVAILLALLVDASIRRSGRWRAPVFFIPLWLVHVGLVGVARIGARGPRGVANDGQYYVDAAFIGIFAVTVLLSQPLVRPPLRGKSLRQRLVGGVVLIGLLAVHFVPMVRSMDVEMAGLVDGGAYWQKAKVALTMPAGSDRYYLPMRLPNVIAPGFTAPANDVGEIRRVFLDDPRVFDGDGSDLVAVDYQGNLRHVAPDVLEADSVGRRAVAGKAAVSGAIQSQDDVQVCFAPDNGGTVDITLDHPIAAPRWPWTGGQAYDIPTFAAIRYETEQAATGVGATRTGDQLALVYDPPTYDKGKGVALFRLDQEQRADHVIFSGFVGRSVCVSDFVVFQPVALPLVEGGACDRLGLGGEVEPNVPCPTDRWDPTLILRQGG